LRLLTFPPEPLFSVPFFRRRMADSTRFDAAFPYFATSHLRTVGTVPRHICQGTVPVFSCHASTDEESVDAEAAIS
jgi:hypothetical protein